MRKKCMSILYLSVMAFSTCIACGAENNDRQLAGIGFYHSPETVIDLIERKGKKISSAKHFMLGVAYKQKKEYKKALFHFANSCFTYDRSLSLTLYASPVYNFVTHFSFKSDYYDDAVYEIAALFYYYREFAYVIKFLDLVSDDNSALYKESLLLKEKSLSQQKKYREALACLQEYPEDIKNKDALMELQLRFGSVYAKMEQYDKALDAYDRVLQLDAESWYAAIAARQIIDIAEARDHTLKKNLLSLVKALYAAKKYDELHTLYDRHHILANGNAEKEHLLEYYLKTLVRLREYDRADAIIAQQKPGSLRYDKLLALKADVLWFMNRKAAAVTLYKKITASNSGFEYREQLRRLALYYYNYNLKLSLAARYFRQYSKKFPEDPVSEKFMWYLAKQALRKKHYAKVLPIVTQMLAHFPQGSYSANARFWSYKIYREYGRNKDARRHYKDMVLYNSGSTYTWILTERIADNFSREKLEKTFARAIAEKNKEKALFSHFLLYFKTRDVGAKHKRMQALAEQHMHEYAACNKALLEVKLSSRRSDTVEQLEKYFAIGYQQGINTVLHTLSDDDEITKDKNIMLSFLAEKYNHHYYKVISTLELLDHYKLEENIALMSDRLVKRILPLGFRDTVERESKHYHIEAYRLYSIIKAESLFHHDVVSPVGAVGLMQLMPFTAKDIARSLKMSAYDLTDYEVSIIFGAYYLSWLKKFFHNNYKEMVGGYNAGAGNVRKWKKNYTFSDEDLFIEYIPFEETRFYILRTSKFLIQYRVIYGT